MRCVSSSIETYDTTLPIRDDLREAHRTVVDQWSHPGTWWTGSERLAIVEEVRRARDTQDVPPPWVSVSAVEGLIDDDHVLPKAAIDAIWRLTNHPGTLTATWYGGITADGEESGITASQYTELVGVVSQANCIDRFADGLSLARVSLPDPVDGQPTRLTPDGAMVSDHWVPTADTEGPQVIRALSGVPDEKAAMLLLSDAQYMPIEAMADLATDRNSLTRMQVELVAARTSKLNECFY